MVLRPIVGRKFSTSVVGVENMDNFAGKDLGPALTSWEQRLYLRE